MTQCQALERPVLPSPITHSLSLDRVHYSHSSSSNHSREDNLYSQPSKSRALWDRRPSIAECQGCIREQDLHHTCGGSSELSLHNQSLIKEEVVRASPVSPLTLRNPRLSPKISSPTVFYHLTADSDQGIIERPAAEIELNSGTRSEMVAFEQTTRNLTDIAGKRGTPLYGQPAWWGESGADEHNRKLLKDMQRQAEEERLQKRETENLLTDLNKPFNGLENKPSSASAGPVDGDTSKYLSFTVDITNSADSSADKAGLDDPLSSGGKLSNFLPENLKKSFRERRERLAQSSERTSQENSPAIQRRSKSPSRSRETSQDKSALFLINKMLHSSSIGASDKAPDEQTEYSMYPEAKVMNRSSTMPELLNGAFDPEQLPRSRTSNSLAVEEGDKVSESGTYTVDEDNKELEKAREDIDKIFGLDKLSPGSPVLEKRETPENVIEVNGSLQVEIGSSQAQDQLVLDGSRNSHKESEASPEEFLYESTRDSIPYNNNDIIAAKPPLSPTSRAFEQRENSPSGRGRRLPVVPRAGRSAELRHSTEVTIGKSNTMPKKKKDVQHSKEKILQELGIGESPMIETERPKLVEELLTSRTYHRDNDPIIVNKTTLFDKIISSTAMPAPSQSTELPMHSTVEIGGKDRMRSVGGQSVDSVNTDVLLQSTDEFMKAIHSFSSDSASASRSKNPALVSSGGPAKSTVSSGGPAKSTVSSGGPAKSTVKQSNSFKKSTADRLSSSNKHNSEGGGDTTTPRKAASSKEPSRRSVAESVTSRLAGTRTSQSKDSEEGSADSLNNSKSTSATRVGPLSSSRPNRTFELRRARTESVESENSVLSTPRTNGGKASGRSARSIDNTEVSLGARIVQKSREMGAVMDQPKQALRRTDGGRYSMRATSTTSKTSGAKTSNVSSSKPAAKKLPSRPNSNSMIARAEREKEAGKEREKAAWDRRRSYNPRKAVQEKDFAKQNGDTRNRIKSYPQCSALRITRRQQTQPAFPLALPNVQAKAKKPDSRGGTPSSADESSPYSSRPRANSYSGENTSRVADVANLNHHESSDMRLGADVFDPTESDCLKLNLEQENVMEDSHELEIAQLSHNVAKDLELLSTADSDPPNRYKAAARAEVAKPSPETEELIESMFACQQQKSAFSSYRSAASATPEMKSPALSPVKKKLSSSQHFENGSSTNIDHSYNELVLTSIKRLSTKLQSYTGNTVDRLKENGLSISSSPSPTADLSPDDMPANTTLASILQTLKSVEHNCRVMDKALFTSSLPQSDLSTVRSSEHEHYLAEIKRIRNEIAGFKPIDDSTKGTKPSKAPTKLFNNNSKPSVSKSSRTAPTNNANPSYKSRTVYY
ncbi:serine-rich adhesin for platelets-like isoform X2 [Watersipora subatra]|uniref:serine-rich adhesin for platelets-like isoform X2 n=1 Tax=Watersipora subatra TaxID=2589382 RepID=UPI00355B71CE